MRYRVPFFGIFIATQLISAQMALAQIDETAIDATISNQLSKYEVHSSKNVTPLEEYVLTTLEIRKHLSSNSSSTVSDEENSPKERSPDLLEQRKHSLWETVSANETQDSLSAKLLIVIENLRKNSSCSPSVSYSIGDSENSFSSGTSAAGCGPKDQNTIGLEIIKEPVTTLPTLSDFVSKSINVGENHNLSVEHREWEQIHFKKKSPIGVDGVIFLSSDRQFQNPIIVKELKGSTPGPFVATHFLSFMGMHVPKTVLLLRSTPEGQRISQAISKAQDLSDKDRPGDLKNDEKHTHFLVMNTILGTSLKKVKTTLISKDLVELGKMYVYDLLLRNTDRIDPFSEIRDNEENIMYDEIKHQITLIDNGVIPSRGERKLKTQKSLKDLYEEIHSKDPNRTKRTADAISKKLFESTSQSENILTGIKQALEEIRKLDTGKLKNLLQTQLSIARIGETDSTEKSESDDILDYITTMTQFVQSL